MPTAINGHGQHYLGLLDENLCWRFVKVFEPTSGITFQSRHAGQCHPCQPLKPKAPRVQWVSPFVVIVLNALLAIVSVLAGLGILADAMS
jgi:hypothetical protein